MQEVCFYCGGIMEYKEIEYDNVKWGKPEVTVKEKARAYVCRECGEMAFDVEEAVRLQKLSMNYR